MQGGNGNDQNNFQDWKPVILTKPKRVNASGPSSVTTVGGKTVTVGSTDTYGTFTKKERELNDATEAKAIVKMPRNIVSQLVAGRIAKNLKQKDLATSLNIDLRIIQDIEANRANHDMALAQRIAGKLGIKLVK